MSLSALVRIIKLELPLSPEQDDSNKRLVTMMISNITKNLKQFLIVYDYKVKSYVSENYCYYDLVHYYVYHLIWIPIRINVGIVYSHFLGYNSAV